MSTLDVINKTREYLDYVEEHVKNVQTAWAVIKTHCTDLRFVFDDYIRSFIDEEVKEHDYSKLSSMEFVQYRQFFYPVHEDEKNSQAFERAWQHHKNNNHHHWQMWTTKAYNKAFGKEIQIVHNVCDWVAMGIHHHERQ